MTKWELTKWELTKWEVDQIGIDEVGIDKVGIDEVGIDKVGIDEVGINLTHYCLEICNSVQLRLAQLFFSSSKSVHAWCFEAILIANNYTPGSSKGNTCVLHTPKSNHKHSVSMVTTPPTVNKAIIIAHRL